MLEQILDLTPIPVADLEYLDRHLVYTMTKVFENPFPLRKEAIEITPTGTGMFQELIFSIA